MFWFYFIAWVMCLGVLCNKVWDETGEGSDRRNYVKYPGRAAKAGDPVRKFRLRGRFEGKEIIRTMTSEQMTLKDLEIGKTATVVSVGGEGALRQHFLDMGLIPEAEITLVKYAPMGDPAEYRIHGYELTLRLDDAEKIQISRPRGRGRFSSG